MMNKKLIPLVLASVMVASVSAQAMQGKGHEFEPQAIIDQLNLDPSTAGQLLNLMQSHRQAMQARQENRHQQSYEAFKMMREQREQFRDSIRALLGDASFDEFERLMWEKRQQRRHQHSTGPEAPQGVHGKHGSHGSSDSKGYRHGNS